MSGLKHAKGATMNQPMPHAAKNSHVHKAAPGSTITHSGHGTTPGAKKQIGC